MNQDSKKTKAVLIRENQELLDRLTEYEQIIAAIQQGEVDAIVNPEDADSPVVTFEYSDGVYRRLVEKMGEGALILSEQGTVLYANQYMANMLNVSLTKLIGSVIDEWIESSDIRRIRSFVEQLASGEDARTIREELMLQSNGEQGVWAYFSISPGWSEGNENTVNVVVTDLTEQKRNETLVAEERLARAILERASDAILVCDLSGRVLRSSATAHRLCGRNPVGILFDECIPITNAEGKPQSFQDILSARDDEPLDLLFAEGNHKRHFRVRASELNARGASGDFRGAVVSLNDITHIKQAEEQAVEAQKKLRDQLEVAGRARRALLSMVEDVKESDARLKNIASRLPGMIYQYQLFPDGSHVVPYASDAMQYIFEVDPEDVRHDATRLFTKIHPDDTRKVAETIKISARNLVPWRHEFRVIHHDQSVRWLAADALPQRRHDDSILWHGFISDVTERKETEAKVRLAANVFEQSREGIVITDANNHIVMVNKGFSQITGYTEKEALGRNPKMLESERHDKEFYQKMWKAIESQGYWEGEIWNRRKDGTDYPEWLSITPTYDDHGKTNGYIGVFEDISQRKSYEQHIQWLAHFDSLTELPNRVLLRDRVEQAISMAGRSKKKLAMLYCDLDRFKNVNDALGHRVGDLLLKAVAERLLAIVRSEDTASRQGGDEFVILLAGADADGAAHVAEKIQKSINQPYDIDGHEMTVSSSIGIAVYPDDGKDFDSLTRNADIAMYRAKQLGRNNYCFYTSELQRVTARSLKLEKDLRGAIENNELELYYQPQISLMDGRITGLEALLRWNHPEFGLVSPMEFIPIAENSGLILRMGDWVTRTGAQQLQSWVASGIPPLKLAVNLSVRELRQPNLYKKLKTILDESELDPRFLELEITESMLMEDQENVIKTLHKISDLGIHLSIDDFGTGYSSLSYLKRLPVNQLKIDKAFVQDMLHDSGDAIIARSIITLGHSLGLNVIAEGVEEGAQLDFLRSHHCDHIQGYIFSKPLPANQVEQLLIRDERLPLVSGDSTYARSDTLLIVDDEPNILSAIRRVLRHDGYNIMTAQSGAEGLDLLAMHEVSVIISDQRMPGMSGIEFLTRAKELYPDSIRIVLSGYTDVQSITDAINRGDIYKFLTKPWEDELLRANIREAFQRYHMALENSRLARELRDSNQTLQNIKRDQYEPGAGS